MIRNNKGDWENSTPQSPLSKRQITLEVKQCRLLFQVFSERYLKGSLLITSNLEFSRWLEVFGDERLTGALLDRLTHHCHALEFNGDSYRFKESLHHREEML